MANYQAARALLGKGKSSAKKSAVKKAKPKKQHACSDCGGALPDQPDPGCQGDEGAEINQCLATRQTLWHWLPYHSEIPLLRPKIPSATMVVAKTT